MADGPADAEAPKPPPGRWQLERATLSALLAFAGPIAACNLLSFLMTIVDLAMVGWLGKEELAVAALATTFWNMLQHPLVGLTLALDTLLAQSFGARELVAYTRWMELGTVVVLAFGLLASVVLSQAEPLLLLIGQDPQFAAPAGDFCRWLIPGIPPFVVFQTCTKFLQAQGVLAPSIVIGVISNVLNVAANWLLIYSLDLGIRGAPLATSFSRWVQCICLVVYIARMPRQPAAELKGGEVAALLAPPRPRCGQFDTSNLQERTKLFLTLALPGAAMLGLEAWTFEVMTFLAGLLGPVALDAQAIMLNVIAFFFLSGPFAVGIATSIQVGHSLGAGDARGAKAAGRVAIVVSLLIMTGFAIIFVGLRGHIALVFTQDATVVAKVASIAPIAAVFQLSDGLQATIGGILRGMGRQLLVAFLNLIGFWALGVVLGAILTFEVGMGLPGLWWGLVLGLTSVALFGVLVVYFTDFDAQVAASKKRISVAASTNSDKVGGDVESFDVVGVAPPSAACREEAVERPGGDAKSKASTPKPSQSLWSCFVPW